LNARFPYVGNIVYPTGVGPVTLSDVYWGRTQARPNWSHGHIWLFVEYAILLSTVLWGALVPDTTRYPTKHSQAQAAGRNELCWFSAAWLVSSLILTIQAYQGEVFDRYYFPSILSLALLAPALLTDARARIGPSLGLRTLIAIGALCALGWFSIAGNHDYVAWNRVRAKLYRDVLSTGVSSSSIDAGYELNGWNNIQADQPATCIRRCQCSSSPWYCPDDSYRIQMTEAVPKGYRLLKQVMPAYWLAKGPTLKLVQRK
jgi:hypothetical protein